MSLKSADYYRSELEANKREKIAKDYEKELTCIENRINDAVKNLASGIYILIAITEHGAKELLDYLLELGYKASADLTSVSDVKLKVYNFHITW